MEDAMPAAVALRDDYDAYDLCKLAGRTKDAKQARRLLALAAIYEGKSREAAADAGGMDRQSLRDWVHAFNAHGPDGLINRVPPGRPPKLDPGQWAALSAIVAQGPDVAKDGIVRWRLSDLKGVINKRFAVDLDEVTVSRLLKKLGFAHVSARPQHPERNGEEAAAFKKTSAKRPKMF
jgi:transposase